MNTEKLIDEILKNSWLSFDHEKLKSDFINFLKIRGFTVVSEYHTYDENHRNRYIDLTAWHAPTRFNLGIEIDRATPKFKSIDKLKLFHPNLSLFILRSKQIPREKIWQRICKFPFKFAVLNLPLKRVVFPNSV